MNNIYDRIKEERLRSGLSQEAFGAIAGVKKLAQFNYENGNRTPDAVYLEAISKAGFDVNYIITGSRQQPIPQHDSQSPDEQLLLNSYRSLSLDAKQELLAAILVGIGCKKDTKGNINITQSNIGSGIAIQHVSDGAQE